MVFLKDVLSEIFKGTVYLVPTFIAVFIISSCIKVIQKLRSEKYPVYFAKATISVSIGLIVLNFNLLLYNSILLYILSVMLMCISIAICLCKALSIQQNLKKVKRLANPKSINYNIIASWKLLQSLSQKKMTPKQQKQYKRFRLYLLIKLGNISAVDATIESFKDDKTYYHFIQHIKYFTMGKIVEASKEIKLAEEAYTVDTDPLLYVQILINRGVNHVCMRNYNIADDYFYKAAEYYKKYKIKEKDLMGTIYYNYAFNKTFMGEDTWESILEEYKTFLDFRKLDDCISYFNTKMELLRQTATERLVIEKIVEESFSQIMSLRFPSENKCFFASSTARMAWAARINPSKYLDTLAENMEVIRGLPMPARYIALKDIDLLFIDLHGDITEKHIKLRKMANDYMLNIAVGDLESYRKDLPEEAILEKCFCYKEVAGLQKKLTSEYDFNKTLSYLNNAISLYHENSLLVDEHICRMAIMDELCSIENLDRDYKLTNSQEMIRQLNEIEAFLPSLEDHNVLAEFYLRLSFYCMHLDDYDKCAANYSKLTNIPISIEHFAPWIHRYYMVTSFAVRTICFIKAIDKIKASKKLVKYVPEVQKWFNTYPEHDGNLTSMLLGSFLGYVDKIPLKLKIWMDPNFSNGYSPRGHFWLWMDELQLNIDITYAQFAGDKYQDCIFYEADRHPFESCESYKIIADAMATGLHFKGVVLNWVSVEDLPPEQKEIFNSIYSIITSNIAAECPSPEKLTRLYIDTMLPVAVTACGVEPG